MYGLTFRGNNSTIFILYHFLTLKGNNFLKPGRYALSREANSVTKSISVKMSVKHVGIPLYLKINILVLLAECVRPVLQLGYRPVGELASKYGKYCSEPFKWQQHSI